MKRLPIILICLLASVFTQAQDKDKFISSSIGYVSFGDGDYSGVNYINSLQLPISKAFDFKLGVQLANAAVTDSAEYHNRHNVFNFANNYNLVFSPVKTDHFILSISAGGVWRYRTEITTQSVRMSATNPSVEHNYTTSYDLGYCLDVSCLVKMTERLYLGLIGQHMAYNQGSGLFSLNIGASYKL